MLCQTCWAPKEGNSPDEYEDAFAGDAGGGPWAIADGASASTFAGLWGRLLVDAFVREPVRKARHWADWLGPLRQRWSAEVDGRERPWYAEAKARQGAFATFLGVALERSWRERRGRWRAIAVGDSCLFQIRAGGLVRSFPVVRADAFGNTPPLVRSRPPTAGAPEPGATVASGPCEPGDMLYLMTDALAQWSLRRQEAGDDPWAEFAALLSNPAPQDAFAPWITGLRDSGALHNDDVTLVAIRLEVQGPTR